MTQTQGEAPGHDGRASKREIRLLSRSPSQRKRPAKRLGWASLGLGLFELAAPGVFARRIGAPTSARTRTLVMACGAREVIVGLGVLGSRDPRRWLWARIVGDAIDMALLGVALTSRRSDKERLAWAAGGVGAMTLMDVIALRRLGTKALMSDAGLERSRIEHTRVVTIMASRSEIERHWQSICQQKPTKHSEPIFTEAPGQRGIEVRVTTTKLRARAVEAKLRRLKQSVEAGQIVQSDASIHRFRHPAKPSKHAKVQHRERELLR